MRASSDRVLGGRRCTVGVQLAPYMNVKKTAKQCMSREYKPTTVLDWSYEYKLCARAWTKREGGSGSNKCNDELVADDVASLIV